MLTTCTVVCSYHSVTKGKTIVVMKEKNVFLFHQESTLLKYLINNLTPRIPLQELEIYVFQGPIVQN